MLLCSRALCPRLYLVLLTMDECTTMNKKHYGNNRLTLSGYVSIDKNEITGIPEGCFGKVHAKNAVRNSTKHRTILQHFRYHEFHAHNLHRRRHIEMHLRFKIPNRICFTNHDNTYDKQTSSKDLLINLSPSAADS